MQPAPVQRQDEIFCVVDRDDHVLGYRTRAECHADATLIHRSVSVVVETSEGMLFQRRSLRKDSSPGFWDVACSGHVDGEETYAEAAVRELGEELGYHGPPPEHLGTLLTGQATANCAFGDDGKTLSITADSLLCRVRLATTGPLPGPGGD